MKFPRITSAERQQVANKARATLKKESASIAREAKRVHAWYDRHKPHIQAAEEDLEQLESGAASFMEKYVPYVIHKLHRERRALLWVIAGLLVSLVALVLVHEYHWSASTLVSDGETLVQGASGLFGQRTSGTESGSARSTNTGKGTPADYAVRGIDVSHWDGDIDWGALESEKLDFIFIKATQGTQQVDLKFAENWASAKSKKLLRGAYHYFDPAADPKAQADYFLKTVAFEKGDLLPVLDIETSGSLDKQKLGNAIQVWLDAVTKKVGHKPIIYTYKPFWDASIQGNKFGHYYLWLAEYETTHQPNLPTDWDSWAFWQYSGSGKVKGINSAKVDLNVFTGSRQHLKRYTLR